ncbi:NUDIX hydrolase [Mammaliicoccus sciuri]|uniref:NUDIX hydrolase n=1 Tax=Mammaliicoccus sciuri TaxID=1296 RepID=UPI0034DD4EE3
MRSTYNILGIPYYYKNGTAYYCILKREDMKVWQFIAGGGENIEPPIETAKREIKEEIDYNPDLIEKLDTMGSVSVEYFKDFKNLWKDGLYVIPIYTFFFELPTKDIKLSKEHTEYQWVTYNKAYKELYFDLDKTALWEVSKRLENKRRNLSTTN